MSRTEGRIIKKHKVTIQGLPVVLPVRLVETEAGMSSSGLLEHSFNVVLPEHDVSVEGKDTIGTAISEAVAQLEKTLAIEWRPAIQLRIPARGEGHHGGYGFEAREVEIQYRFLEIGTAAEKEVWRRRGDSTIHTEELTRGDWESTDRWSLGRSATFAVIDDTPANRNAIEQICGAFVSLQAKLREFLHQDQVVGTFANLSRLALPAPVRIPDLFDDEEDS